MIAESVLYLKGCPLRTIGTGTRDRTGSLPVISRMLCRLSYACIGETARLRSVVFRATTGRSAIELQSPLASVLRFEHRLPEPESGVLPLDETERLERVNGIEPIFSVWKTEVLAVVRHPHGGSPGV